MAEKTVAQLEQELADLRDLNAWRTYGSELCTGNMFRKERELELRISALPTIERSEWCFGDSARDELVVRGRPSSIWDYLGEED